MQYVLYRFYNKQYECQSGAVVLHNLTKACWKCFQLKGQLGAKV